MNSVEMTVTHSTVRILATGGCSGQLDPFVKVVMLLLVLASVWCWAIVVDKITIIRRERRLAQAFEDSFWSGDETSCMMIAGATPRDAMSIVFVAAIA